MDCIVILQINLLCIKLDYSDLIRVDSIETITAVCQTKLIFDLAVQIQPLTASDHGKQQIIVMRQRARNTSNNIQCKPTRSAPHHVSNFCVRATFSMKKKQCRRSVQQLLHWKLIAEGGGSRHAHATSTSTSTTPRPYS